MGKIINKKHNMSEFIGDESELNTLSEPESIKDILSRVYKEIALNAKTEGNVPCMSTGIHDVDRTIGGLRDTDLILVGARPGMGKTKFVLDIALNVAKTEKKGIAYFSLDTSCEQLVLMALAAVSFIDKRKLRAGRLTDEEWQILAVTAALLGEMDIKISDDASITVSEITGQCKQMSNVGLIIIDNIHLMQPPEDDGVFENGFLIKKMAQELNVPVICLTTLARVCLNKGDYRPELTDFRDINAIDKYADIVIGLYRNSYYETDAEDNNHMECIILRNRRGEKDICYYKY